MKEILILSDSHGCYPLVQKAVEAHPHAKGIIFLGDGLKDIERLQTEGCSLPVYAVRGNCDFSSLYPAEALEVFEHSLVFFCHGHHYGVKYTLDDYARAVKDRGAAIGLFGHTHLPTLEQRDGVTLFNPGSIGAPRFGGPSYGILELYENGEFNLQHKELIIW